MAARTRPDSAARGRPREFDPDVVVERAMDVFSTKGFGATSMPDLIASTGLSRGSLYQAFGDKHQLFLYALDRYIEQSLARFDADLDPKLSAVAGLRTCLYGYVERSAGPVGVQGCLVVSTAMELAAHDSDAAQRIRRFLDSVETRFAGALRRAQTEGRLRAGVDPGAAARILLSVVEGLRVVAKTGIDAEAWEMSVDTLLDGLTRP